MLSLVFGLGSAITTLLTLCAPFCVLQLALCRFCRSRLLRALPPMLAAFGCVAGLLMMYEYSDWGALASFLFVLCPSVIGLLGSGLGWALWRWSSTHLY